MTLNDSQLSTVRQSVAELLAATAPLRWEQFILHADKLAYAGDWPLLTALVKRLATDGKEYSHAFIYLLAALKSARGKPAWSQIAEVAELLQLHGEWRLLSELFAVSSGHNLPPRAYELQLMAVRGTDGYVSVLKTDDVVGARYEGQSYAVAIQCAAICSEIGDFAGVLSIAEPSDAPSANELIDWEILKAWAYENSVHPHEANKASLLFTDIQRRIEELTDSEIADYQSPHPEARVSVPGAQRSMLVVRKLWAKRGYADALSKLEPPGGQPPGEWRDFLNEVLNLPESIRRDPYVARMAAWCRFQLRQFDSALSEYRNTIRDGYSKYRIQFEQALVLLHMGRANASVDLYEKALADAKELNVFRRTAVLRVALRQLFDDMHRSPEVVKQSYGYTILESFKHEIHLALGELRGHCPKLTARVEQDFQLMQGYLDGLWPKQNSDTKSSDDLIEWKKTKIVGFPDPGTAWFALLVPVVEYCGSRFTWANTTPKEADPHFVVLEPATDEIKHLQHGSTAGPDTRILYLSESAKRVLLASLSELPTAIAKSFPADSGHFTICVDKMEATRRSEELGARLVETVFRHYNQLLNTSELGATEKTKIETARAQAQLAFYVGFTKNTVYQALLLYRCLTELLQEESAVLARMADGEISRYLPSENELRELSLTFKEKVSVASIQRSSPSGNTTTISQLADLVIQRGRTISGITDPHKGILQAEWAAAELQLICRNNKESFGLQDELKRIQQSSAIYLEKDLRTIALGLEAAFYRSVDVSAMNRPKLDVFAYYKGGKNLDEQSYKWLAVSS